MPNNEIMSQSTQRIILPGGGNLPEGLQEAIDRYFVYFDGSAKQLEAKLYSMLEDALVDEGHCTVYPPIEYLCVYRRTKELVEALEVYTSKRRIDLDCN